MFKQEITADLLELSSLICSVPNLEQLGDLLVEKIGAIFKAKKVSLMLLDKEKKDLFVWAASQMHDALKQVKVEYGQMFAGWVAKEGKPLLVKNVDSEFPQFSKVKIGRYQSKSFIIAPIKSGEEISGVINVTERENSDIFDEDDLQAISLINSLVALQMEKIRLAEKIDSLSIIDSLTGLINHRHFQERLSEEIDRVQRYRRHCSMILLDVDNFAAYNENYGYAMGEKVLLQMANIVKENLRKVDIISRYAGEQISVLMPDTGRKDAGLVAEKLREKIESAVFVEKRTSALSLARLTVSAGVAEYNVNTNKEQFIQQVKDALLEAKQKGKNRVCVHR
jgi:diguanylate cyclase (GGDEF)-like protein